MSDASIPHAKTPVSDRIAAEFGRDWYRFFQRLFAARSGGYRVVDGGTAVLVAGSVTVTNRKVRAGDIVQMTRQVSGGTRGHLSVGTVTPGLSFVIDSSSAADTSTIGWTILSPIT